MFYFCQTLKFVIMYENIPKVKVKLNPEIIANNIQSEEYLSDYSILDSFYEIRRLRACILSPELIVHYPINEHNQCYSEEYDICFDFNQFTIIE